MIIDILKYIFSSFWIWLGTVIILDVIFSALHGIVKINKVYTIDDKEIDKEKFIKELLKDKE